MDIGGMLPSHVPGLRGVSALPPWPTLNRRHRCASAERSQRRTTTAPTAEHDRQAL